MWPMLKSYLLSEREFTIISKETVKALPCKKSWYFLRGIVLLRIGEPNCIISDGRERPKEKTRKKRWTDERDILESVYGKRQDRRLS